MSRQKLDSASQTDRMADRLHQDMMRRIVAAPAGQCPVDMQLSFLKLCLTQTCGKCVPCRVGLRQLKKMLEDVVEGRGTLATLEEIEKLSSYIADSADCALGFETAALIRKSLETFKEDYLSHINEGKCLAYVENPVPCVGKCPAHVDVPGYIALVKSGRYADAVRLIRKDNPFPTACALICEHPCESRCRRIMIDAPVNIRAIKRKAVDEAPSNTVPNPQNGESTGKRVAVIGGGPAGLTCAYYLELMGHHAVVFEEKSKLGGMVRYGIPNYRFPRTRLQEDLDCILSTGVEVRLNTRVGNKEGEVTLESLRKEFDAVYIAIGAHNDKKLGIEGEDAKNVMSAVEMLRKIGDETPPDFKDKTVVIVGGGNVAMDCTRSAIRLGAKKVYIAYRRRKIDMTALPEEIDGAVAEGAELYELMAPNKIEKDAEGKVAAFWVEPQIIGPIDATGRAKPIHKDVPLERIACDIVVVAIGQAIDSKPFGEEGIPLSKDRIAAGNNCEVEGCAGIFSGGDCATGPATVIRAIAAGKTAAANIDEYLGFDHKISCDVEIPEADISDHTPCARIELALEESGIRKNCFDPIEKGLTDQESLQECGRCLRCDQCGFGALRGGRELEW